MNKKQLIVAFVITIILLTGCFNNRAIAPIKGTWENLSRVFDNFGVMTIDNGSIAWGSGQKSAYRLVKHNKDEIVIELTERVLPKFHGGIYKFIKFSLKDSSSKLWKKELHVSFYEKNYGLDDNCAMWGIYVR